MFKYSTCDIGVEVLIFVHVCAEVDGSKVVLDISNMNLDAVLEIIIVRCYMTFRSRTKRRL